LPIKPDAYANLAMRDEGQAPAPVAAKANSQTTFSQGAPPHELFDD
jgi:hypothetical protein